MEASAALSQKESSSLGKRSRLYFVNGWVDGAVIGGLSIAVFVPMRLYYPGPRTSGTILVASILSIFVTYPHFSATVYRLYQSPQNIRQFPVTSLGLPILMMAAIAGSIWQPALVAPYFLLLYLFWSPYHYSGQTLGITMIYARRSGCEISRWQRVMLSGFIFSTFVLSFAQSQNGAPISFYGTALPQFHFPDWFIVGSTVTIGVAAAAFLGLALHRYYTRGLVLRPIVLLPAIAQFVWFMPGVKTPVFYEFVPTFHGLQYLYIAWAMQLGQRLSRAEADRSWQSIVVETLRWLVPNYAGGIVLFLGLPWLFFWADLPMLTVVAIVTAAVNIHHFFVDGVIWKLRNTTSQSPLMMNIAQFAVPSRA